MTNFVHKNDLPADVTFKDAVAIDTETMGLNIFRDRLCVVQLSDGNGDAHLVHFDETTRSGGYIAPNLKKILADNNIQKIFHYARFDLAVLKEFAVPPGQPLFGSQTASFPQHPPASAWQSCSNSRSNPTVNKHSS